jgi:hypothetical protein
LGEKGPRPERHRGPERQDDHERQRQDTEREAGYEVEGLFDPPVCISERGAFGRNNCACWPRPYSARCDFMSDATFRHVPFFCFPYQLNRPAILKHQIKFLLVPDNDTQIVHRVPWC